MAFKHGIFTRAGASTSQGVNTLPSAIIALVGVSAVGPVNALTLCNNDTDDAQWGEATPDNSIAMSLKIIRNAVKGASAPGTSDGSCAVIVVNVYNASTHKTLLNSTATPDATTGKCSLSKTLIGDLSAIKIKQGSTAVNVAASGTYIYGTDYTLDRYGNFVDITGTYKGQVLTFGGVSGGNYYLNTSSVAAADIIGTNTSGVRTGRVLLDTAETALKLKPKILICPTYAALTGVAADFETAATSYRAVFLSDAPSGTSLSAALALRTTGQWATSSPSVRPVFPWLKTFNGYVNNDIIYPFSAFAAGMYVANDNNDGPWTSVSNQQIPGVTGVELVITGGYSNSGSEATLLNAQGIMTYNQNNGFVTWGNRNASYPAKSDVLTFDNVYRMDCQVADEMENAGKQFVDKLTSPAFRDIIRNSGNNYLKTLMQKGAILPGSEIIYDPAKNSPTALANGTIVFTRKYMVYTPAEDIEIENILDITLFNNVNK